MQTRITRRQGLKLLAGTAAAAMTAAPGLAAVETDDLERFDALGLADLVTRGEVSPTALLERAVTRAEAMDKRFNFLAHRFYDTGRKAIEAGLPDGPFRGVPFLLKDLGTRLADHPITNGSRAFQGYVPTVTDEIVRRYQQAGLVIFGRTTSPEFGLTVTTENRLNGPTLNPWDTDRSPGGSSGGAAVAVATGVTPIAQASDGGGSIRVPASVNGLFGLKPTRGRTPKGPGLTESWNGLSITHVITRSVRDSAAMLDATAGDEAGTRVPLARPSMPFAEAARRDPRPLRIALMKEPIAGTPVDPVVLAGLEDTARLCEDLGHEVVEDAPAVDAAALSQAMIDTIAVDTLRAMQSWANTRGHPIGTDEVETVTAWLMDYARNQVGPMAYANAGYAFQKAAYDLAIFMQDYDLILSPTIAEPPALLGRLKLSPDNFDQYVTDVPGYSPFTALFNWTGQPAMSVPLYWSADNLPIGSMFAAPPGDEVTLFQLAGQLERARPWAARRPLL